jgi:hypothetical protein
MCRSNSLHSKINKMGTMPQYAYVFKMSMRRKFTPILHGSEQYDYLRGSEVVKKKLNYHKCARFQLQPKYK